MVMLSLSQHLGCVVDWPNLWPDPETSSG